MNNHSIAVVYHGGCNDGIASAWAAWRTLGDKAEYIPWYYGDPVPQADGKVVIMVDISPTPKEVEEIRSTAKALMIVDHHDSSVRLLEGLPCGITSFNDFMDVVNRESGVDVPVYLYADKSRSGAVLSWMFFNNVTGVLDSDIDANGHIPEALLLIEDYDLFVKQLVDTVPFNEWLASTGRYIDNFDRHVNPDGTPDTESLHIGRALVKKTTGIVRDIMRNYVRLIDWRGYKVAVVNGPSHVRNEVSEEIMKKHHDVDFVMVYQIRSAKVVVSLRGRDKRINMGVIAGEFGGGGHEDAAAFSINLDDQKLMDALGISGPGFS
ncbi:hypothetical protein D3C85_16050 [compost metagenome]